MRHPDEILASSDVRGIVPVQSDGFACHVVGPRAVLLKVICSWGMGWDHVSVSLESRCPSWAEMCWVKDLFFKPEECVVQYHPPESTYKHLHPYCLHLWRPQGAEIPMPSTEMV